MIGEENLVKEPLPKGCHTSDPDDIGWMGPLGDRLSSLLLLVVVGSLFCVDNLWRWWTKPGPNEKAKTSD